MNIGIGSINVQITLKEIGIIFNEILEVLQMNIPVWFIIIILCIFYIINWRQRIFNWRAKHTMLRLWRYIYDLKIQDFRDKGRNETEIEDLTKGLKWEEIFFWEIPKINSPKLLPKIRRSKKDATT